MRKNEIEKYNGVYTEKRKSIEEMLRMLNVKF
jgi:hypothetical protein